MECVEPLSILKAYMRDGRGNRVSPLVLEDLVAED